MFWIFSYCVSNHLRSPQSGTRHVTLSHVLDCFGLSFGQKPSCGFLGFPPVTLTRSVGLPHRKGPSSILERRGQPGGAGEWSLKRRGIFGGEFSPQKSNELDTKHCHVLKGLSFSKPSFFRVSSR